MSAFGKIVAVALAFASLPLYAQEPAVEMADGLRASGKIYVVVGVLVIIFLGITVYLIALDRRLRRMEKKMKNKTT